MPKLGMYPPPVYEATFSDGSRGRMSFWSAAGKPFDFARGRRVLSVCYARPEHGNYALDCPARIVCDGYVIHDGRNQGT